MIFSQYAVYAQSKENYRQLVLVGKLLENNQMVYRNFGFSTVNCRKPHRNSDC